MFGLFKKGGGNNNSHKPASPEGEKLSKPISGNIQGVLREALEKIAYTLENDLQKNQHIITFVATIDPAKEGPDESGLQEMDCAFVRASDESIGDILMQVSMRDDTFAKAMIAVSEAVQFHKEHLKDFADKLKEQVEDGQRNGEIPLKSGLKGFSKNKKHRRRGLNLESFGDGIKGINLDDLKNASDEDIDRMLDGIIPDED